MDKAMMDNFLMDKNMEKVNIFGQMEIFIQVNLEMIKDKDQVLINGVKEEIIEDNGKQIE